MLQLALQGALIVHLLIELRTHPVGLVEDLKSQPPALQAALGRGRQARLVQLRRRNPDARSVVGRFKGNLRLGKNLRGLARVLGVQIGVERAPVGAQPIPQQAHGQGRDQARSHQRPVALGRLHRRPANPAHGPECPQPVAQPRLPGCCRRALLHL